MVHSQELLGGATKGLEADEDPEFLCSPEGDVIDMGGPTEVAGDDDTKQARLVNDFKGLTFGEIKLGQEVKLFGKVERDYLGLLVVYFHLIVFSEDRQVSQLMLKNGVIYWEDKARDFMKVRWTNDRGGWDK